MFLKPNRNQTYYLSFMTTNIDIQNILCIKDFKHW